MEHYITSGTAEIWTTINDETPNCSKPYLLMCGGGPGVNDGLNEVDALLNTSFNTIRFNHRGCGSSTADGNYNIETVLNDIEAIRQFYSVDSWHVLGHSWGANIALFYTLKFPQYCKSVIYLCGLGVQNDIDWSAECAKNAAEETEPERPPRFYMDDTMNYDVLDAEIHSFAKYIQSPMLLKDISMLPIPVCVVCSGKDLRPMWSAVQLSNLLPMGNIKILNDCGHFPWLTHPDLLTKSIFNWFDYHAK